MAKRPVEKYDFKAFGEAIKAARTGRKESRKQVSDEMYISPRYLANIENKGQHPSLQIFFELMLRYNISVDQFLLDTPAEKNTKRRQLDALLDDMNDNIKGLLSDSDGKVYGVPRDAYGLGLMCNVELFEKAGLVDENGVPKFPKTFDELAETAKKIKEKTGAAGLCLLAKDNSGGWHFSNIAWNFGAKLVTDNGDGTYTSNLNSKEAVAAMQYVSDLKWKYDVLTADPTAEDWGTGFQQLGTGGAAMYIAANDAVAQPTQTNGLDVKKLALGAMPAGPNGDQYSLTGGTPYMFSKDATPEQISAAFDFLEVMGKAPEANDTTIKGMEADAANRKQNGVPVIQTFPCWTNKEYVDANNKVVEEYSNVDTAMFQQFFDAVNKEGNLHTEEPGDAQEMYAQLTNVLQAVITNKDADIQKLMDTANSNYQKTLDSEFKKN